MSKKKNKALENDKSFAQADLTNLIDAAKNSLFELDDSYSFIEEKPSVEVHTDLEEQTVNEEDVDVDVEAKTDFKERAEVEAYVEVDAQNDSEEQAELSLQANFKEMDCLSSFDADASANVNASANLGCGVNLISDLHLNSQMSEASFQEGEPETLESIFDTESEEHQKQNDEFNLLESAFAQQQAQPIEQYEVPHQAESDFESTHVQNSTAEALTSVEGTELESFESAQIEELEFITEDQLQSVLESIFFATDRPVSIATIKQVFEGTNVTTARIRSGIENLKSHYASSKSGVTLDDIGSGFQLRTKLDNMEFLRRSLKSRPFKLSGPALEVLAIVAYKQPIIKSEIDEIRGVESGHLLRALMEKNLCSFAGKSDLPGKPMLYETTRKFLEIFSLRNLKELPTLSQIDELLPEGIGDEADQKPKLGDITEGLSHQVGTTYSEGEEELHKITGQLEEIQTTTDFFEKEKLRQKEQRDVEKAQNIRDAMAVGEEVNSRDRNWLKRYDEQKLIAESGGVMANLQGEEDSFKPDVATVDSSDEFDELSEAMDALDEEMTLIDPEIVEANDIADIEN